MKFAVFLMADSNYHIAGWRHPDAYVDAGSNIQRWIEFAKTLERGKLDMLFVADVIGVPGVQNPESLRYASTVDKFEPFTLLAALSSVTQQPRPRRDLGDRLQRALQRRAHARLARSSDRRPRRLESGHRRQL